MALEIRYGKILACGVGLWQLVLVKHLVMSIVRGRGDMVWNLEINFIG